MAISVLETPVSRRPGGSTLQTYTKVSIVHPANGRLHRGAILIGRPALEEITKGNRVLQAVKGTNLDGKAIEVPRHFGPKTRFKLEEFQEAKPPRWTCGDSVTPYHSSGSFEVAAVSHDERGWGYQLRIPGKGNLGPSWRYVPERGIKRPRL
jgi:hypothetical protein